MVSLMIPVLKYVKGCYEERDEQLFSLATEGRTQRNGFKLQQLRFRLNLIKTSLLSEQEVTGTSCLVKFLHWRFFHEEAGWAFGRDGLDIVGVEQDDLQGIFTI